MGVAVGAAAAQRAPRAWVWAAVTWSVVVSLAVGYFVWRIPVQLTDCLANLFQVQDQTWLQSVTAGVGSGYMRPLLWAQIKAMFEFANGHYTVLFRSIHVVQVVACALLFVGALRVRDGAGALAVPFGIALLFGAHTFYGAVGEAFPINSFLTVVLACLAAVNLSLGTPRRSKDAAAIVLLVFVLLTVESGGLVWVCIVAAWVSGARGVSKRAMVAATFCLVAYAIARFVLLDVGTPDLLERPSGFGFRAIEPDELKARFGAFPWAFYAYNVFCQISTVLFSEPRTGVFVLVRTAVNEHLTPGQVVSVFTAMGTTLLIVRYAVIHASRWRRREFDDGDRVVLVFAAVLAANALISFPYTKDVIVSPAGALHALAGTVALRDLLSRLAAAPTAAVVPVCIFVALISSAAAVRLAGMCYALREASFIKRNDWTEVESWAKRNEIDLAPPHRAALVQRLRDDAIARRVPPPAFANPDLARYFY